MPRCDREERFGGCVKRSEGGDGFYACCGPVLRGRVTNASVPRRPVPKEHSGHMEEHTQRLHEKLGPSCQCVAMGIQEIRDRSKGSKAVESPIPYDDGLRENTRKCTTTAALSGR